MSFLSVATAASAGSLAVESRDMASGRLAPEQFANVFGCAGGNVSPEIRWSGAPEGTQSYVVTLYDPDATTGSGFWHWVAVDIPAGVTSLSSGAGDDASRLPKGAYMVRNDAGDAHFLGACPPEGTTHRYVLTVKAIKIAKLPVPENATPALVGFVSNMLKLDEARIVATGAR
ncbi:YbhB/YbcL family Raf kinase inhibitor-like protein [Rhizobium sp. FKL33]|uniref:YbhB/YbcL family Raf kinase inhibitor-like protein n=1 Tax=Rhizobium sp. FKL33 TaxID=2562307 RepID=UPI0010C13A4E|nr:YbhB/YbcL family Raf kinase inhibitor-like protein [Rhizobium sp. FKL33]